MRKILFVVNKLIVGGAEVATVNQVNSLNNKDFEVFLGLMYSTTKKDNLYEQVKLDDRHIIHFNFSKLFDLKAVYRIYKYLKSNKIDLVFSGLFESNTVVRVASFFARVSVVITEHSCYYNKKFWQKKIDKLLSYFTVCIIGVSNEVVKFTSKQEKISISKFLVLDQFYDFDIKSVDSRTELRNKLGISKDSFVVMTVGRFSKEKCQEKIIDIAQRLVEFYNQDDVYFYIIGNGKLEENLKFLIRKNNLEKYVKLIVEPKDAKRMLPAGDLFISTSEREGMPLAILEAMSCGLPILSFYVGGIPDLLDKELECGFLCEKNDLECMCNKIMELKNDERFFEYRENAKKVAVAKKGDVKDLVNLINKTLNK